MDAPNEEGVWRGLFDLADEVGIQLQCFDQCRIARADQIEEGWVIAGDE
jgi:hypothetical protein